MCSVQTLPSIQYFCETINCSKSWDEVSASATLHRRADVTQFPLPPLIQLAHYWSMEGENYVLVMR